MEVNSEKSKILYIHGYRQNSEIFKKRVKVITKAVKKELSLDYLIPDGHINLDGIYNSGNEVLLGWALREDRTIDFNICESTVFLGIEKSIEILKNLLKKNKVPAIIGFSQGAFILSVLCFLSEKDQELKAYLSQVKCVISASGFHKPYPSNLPEIKPYFLGEIEIDIPSLHVYGKNDDQIPAWKSELLSKTFKNHEIYCHEGKHFLPSKKEDVAIYIKFMKKHIYGV